MLEYLKIIDKKFQNKEYFSSLISLHQRLKSKSCQKKELFVKLGLTAIAIFGTLSLVSAFIFHSVLAIAMVFGCAPLFVILLVVEEFIGRQEIKYMNQIESEFFRDLKNNHDLIKDLSLLVVDGDTEKSFNEIVDSIMQDSNDDVFVSFNNLIYNYDYVQLETDAINERNNFLQKIKINVKKHIVQEDDKESFQMKARERVMEML